MSTSEVCKRFVAIVASVAEMLYAFRKLYVYCPGRADGE